MAFAAAARQSLRAKKAPRGALFFMLHVGLCAAQWLRRSFLTTIHRGTRNRTMLRYSHT